MSKVEEYKTTLKQEGFKHIFEWTDKADTVYEEHSHQDKVVLFIVSGDLYFTYVGDKEIRLIEGDRFDVTPKRNHTARVGSKGCKYIVGEMIEGDS
ncbi:MAG: hypothetical protein RI996_561 [Candidatus Parcubacteria bacterium]